MADFLAEDHEDLLLSQVADAMEYEYVLDQAVSDYIPKSETVNFGLNFDLDYLSSWLNDEESVKLEPIEDIASTRFGKPASDKDIKNLVDGQKNCNTDKNTKWALGVFNAWRKERGSDIPELIAMSPESMNFWLSRFIMEARKRDGGDYPPKSLYLISCGLLRHLKDNEVNINFLNDKDFTFTGFRKVLDSRMKELLTKGFGTDIKQADPILLEDEETIWNNGVFGSASSESLQHTIFFYCCKLFGLRGYDEHRALLCEQFTVGDYTEDTRFVHFIGRSSKTFKGGLAQKELQNKDIKHYCKKGM